MRMVDHNLMLLDAVAYAITLDALNNEGAADEHRISKKTCLHVLPKGMPFSFRAGMTAGYNDLAKGI